MDAGTRGIARRIARPVAALALSLAMLLPSGCGKKEEEVKPQSGLAVGYATQGVTVVDDPDELQRQVDEMMREAEEGVSLEYQNDCYSVDGKNFSCYMANPVDNAPYDMFVAIYTGDVLDEPIYLSQLLRPGQAFESITLDEPVDPGNHEVTVAYNLVETVGDEQTMHGQALVSMNLIVTMP